MPGSRRSLQNVPSVLVGGRQDSSELPRPCSVHRVEILVTLEGLERVKYKTDTF